MATIHRVILAPAFRADKRRMAAAQVITASPATLPPGEAVRASAAEPTPPPTNRRQSRPRARQTTPPAHKTNPSRRRRPRRCPSATAAACGHSRPRSPPATRPSSPQQYVKDRLPSKHPFHIHVPPDTGEHQAAGRLRFLGSAPRIRSTLRRRYPSDHTHVPHTMLLCHDVVAGALLSQRQDAEVHAPRRDPPRDQPQGRRHPVSQGRAGAVRARGTKRTTPRFHCQDLGRRCRCVSSAGCLFSSTASRLDAGRISLSIEEGRQLWTNKRFE